MFHTRLNNFPVLRNYRDIDFALRYMDVQATNVHIAIPDITVDHNALRET